MPEFLISEHLTWTTVASILAVGAAAGFINVTAGGGSLLTLPLMILIGLPESVANGTNRVAIVVQNVVAGWTFRRGGVVGMRNASWLILAALPGTLVGAYLGTTVSGPLFRKVLGGLMIFLAAFIVMQRTPKSSGALDSRPRAVTLASFAGLGLYAGFIQAGIGFLIISVLTGVEKLNIVRTNAIKVLVILVLQIVSLAVFASQGLVDWIVGLTLAIGLATGGFAGAHVTMRGSERLVRGIVAVGAVALALKLLFG